MIDEEKERKDFEEWYAADCMPAEADWFKRDPEEPTEYFHGSTQSAWSGWLKRAIVEYYKVVDYINKNMERSILSAITKIDPKNITIQNLDLSLQETSFSKCGGQLYTFLSPEPYDAVGPAKFGVVLWVDRNEIRNALQQTLCTKDSLFPEHKK